MVHHYFRFNREKREVELGAAVAAEQSTHFAALALQMTGIDSSDPNALRVYQSRVDCPLFSRRRCRPYCS